MITKNKKYDNCEVTVNYEWKNAHGQPALVRKSDGKWIQWVSKRDLPFILKMEMHEVQ
jgi:hypothetical protein